MARTQDILAKNHKSTWSKSVAIIIPAFNEYDNLIILLEKIKKLLPYSLIFIVDDSSEEIFNKLKSKTKRNKYLYISHRNKKSGRGSAVISGLKIAVKNKNLKYFFEMDADLSHDPNDFAKFLTSIQKDRSDVVIGSRYISFSKVTKWPLYRLVLSKIINFCLNILLGLELSDYTNGFRLYSRKAAEFLVKVRLKETGFIMLSETAFKLKKNGYKISEVPIHFTDRKHGKSSVDSKELLSSLIGALNIRFKL